MDLNNTELHQQTDFMIPAVDHDRARQIILMQNDDSSSSEESHKENTIPLNVIQPSICDGPDFDIHGFNLALSKFKKLLNSAI